MFAAIFDLLATSSFMDAVVAVIDIVSWED
jgi:hypothetical protein